MECYFCRNYNRMRKQTETTSGIPGRIIGVAIVKATCEDGIIKEKEPIGFVLPNYCPVCGKWLIDGTKENPAGRANQQGRGGETPAGTWYL